MGKLKNGSANRSMNFPISIFLKVIKHAPNFTFFENSRFVEKNVFRYVLKKLIEDIIKNHEVNKIREILIIYNRTAEN